MPACPHSPGLLWFRILPQGLLPFVYPAPKAGQNNGPFGGNGKKPETAQNREINLGVRTGCLLVTLRWGEAKKGIQAFQALNPLTQSSPFF